MTSLKRVFIRVAAFLAVAVIGAGCYISYEASQTSTLNFMLLAAAGQGNIDGVKTMLANGTDPNYSFNGHTPLAAAREHHFKEVEHLLLAHGARP